MPDAIAVVEGITIEEAEDRVASVDAYYKLWRQCSGAGSTSIQEQRGFGCTTSDTAAPRDVLPYETRAIWSLSCGSCGRIGHLRGSSVGALDLSTLSEDQIRARLFKLQVSFDMGLSADAMRSKLLAAHERIATMPPLMSCGGCKRVLYCNAACQRAHWREHKGACKNETNVAILGAPLISDAPSRSSQMPSEGANHVAPVVGSGCGSVGLDTMHLSCTPANKLLGYPIYVQNRTIPSSEFLRVISPLLAAGVTPVGSEALVKRLCEIDCTARSSPLGKLYVKRIGYVTEPVPPSELASVSKALKQRAAERLAARVRGAAGLPTAIDDIDDALRTVTFRDDAGVFRFLSDRGLVPTWEVNVIIIIAPSSGVAALCSGMDAVIVAAQLFDALLCG